MAKKEQKLKLVALTPAQIAQALSAACSEKITEERVREIAQRGKLIKADGTVSLIEYAAFLVQEIANR